MSETDKRNDISSKEISDYLTHEEREKLLANLHRVLVWVRRQGTRGAKNRPDSP